MTGLGQQVDTFRHEALIYAGWPEFIAGTVPFILDGVRAGEPVLVVESVDKIQMLRSALGSDADSVVFGNMAEIGANPARIIPAWRDFVDRHGDTGKGLRGIGEPIWNGRTDDELVECQRHESLLNVAFGKGRPWWLLCPYDAAQLAPAVLDEARRSHEFVREGDVARESPAFRGIAASGARFDVSLQEAPARAVAVTFDALSLLKLRAGVSRYAIHAGMGTHAAAEFVTAVNEVATNSVVHGHGGGTLRIWRTESDVVCEIRDAGDYDHPLGDRCIPEADADPRGLWLANQLCDLVQVRSTGAGTTVRLHKQIDPRPRLRLLTDSEDSRRLQ